MKGRKLLVVESDPRISRLICRVAQRMELSCEVISAEADLRAACREGSPDVVWLDPGEDFARGADWLQALTDAQCNAAIVLARSGLAENAQTLRDLGESLGLRMADLAPEVFDADTLKDQLAAVL